MIGGNEKNVRFFGHIEEKLSEPAALALSNQRLILGKTSPAWRCLNLDLHHMLLPIRKCYKFRPTRKQSPHKNQYKT